MTIVVCLGCKKTTKVQPTNLVSGRNWDDSTNVQHISVLTQHNDNGRAGLNDRETALNVDNVNTSHFGKLFLVTTDDDIYAQPLVVGGLPMGTGRRNVLFVATVSNTIYAYDADNGKLFWNKNYTESGMRPPSAAQFTSPVWWCSPYTDFRNNIGIVGTPVIDSASKTMYFVARSSGGNTSFVQYLHAIDIVTGAEQPGSPVQLKASVPGTGAGSSNGMVSFEPKLNNQRQGLAMVNGVVFISFASHCDLNPFHGWILGYDVKSLSQRYVYCDTPNGEEGGIWECGMGIAADQQGNLYVTTGNGTVGAPTIYSPISNGSNEPQPSSNPADLTNRSESALKLVTSGNTLAVSSFFTPTNYVDLNLNDLDYGVMGTFLIPHSNSYFTGCKDGNLYLLDKDNMGGYSSSGNSNKQVIPFNTPLRSQPSYYNGGNVQSVYVWPESESLHAFTINAGSGVLSEAQVFTPATPPQNFGASLSVSSNGSTPGTGIVWASYQENKLLSDGTHINGYYAVYEGILRAFDARNISKELWNSDMVSSDAVGGWAKFVSPTIANGKVYVATFSNQLVVYGLKR